MRAAPALPDWDRAVVKVGSALVAPNDRGCSTTHLLPIARFVIESRRQGKEVILVSSGAVVAGLAEQGRDGPGTGLAIPERQALAAIGQPQLMAHWRRLFDVPCAQVLLTDDDLQRRSGFVNAKNTIQELLDRGASLLPSGVVAVEGDHARGDVVQVVTDEEGASPRVTKGITQYGAGDLLIRKWVSTDLRSVKTIPTGSIPRSRESEIPGISIPSILDHGDLRSPPHNGECGLPTCARISKAHPGPVEPRSPGSARRRPGRPGHSPRRAGFG